MRKGEVSAESIGKTVFLGCRVRVRRETGLSPGAGGKNPGPNWPDHSVGRPAHTARDEGQGDRSLLLESRPLPDRQTKNSYSSLSRCSCEARRRTPCCR